MRLILTKQLERIVTWNISGKQTALFKWGSKNIHDYKDAKNRSKFAHNLLDNRHSIGPKEDIMDIIHTTNKGRLLDKVKGFFIYNEKRKNNQLNDKCTTKPNTVFHRVILEDTDREPFTS